MRHPHDQRHTMNKSRRETMAGRNPREYALALVETYFRMLTIGCGATARPLESVGCTNANCRSSSSSRAMAAADAAVLSVYLATGAPAPLCIPLGRYCDSRTRLSVPLDAEERPETDEDEGVREEPQEKEESARGVGSTPRRRLSSAVELDLALRHDRHSVLRDDDDDNDKRALEAEEPGRRVSSSAVGGRRKLSLPKQKLLDAIKKTKTTTTTTSTGR